MSDDYGLLLTGRPVSRTTSRAYESYHQTPNSSRQNQDVSAWALEEDSDDAFDQSLTSDQMITGYQTMKDTRSLHLPHSRNQKQNYTNSQSHYEHDLNDMRPESGYTPRQSMPRTRNRYRPVKQRPTECDDSLFGKPIQEEFKEWKAPWDNSKNVKPLLYDSTDRAGHFSQNKPKTIRQTKSASTRRAWR